ncbi:Alcohol dehydrogenase GroES-like protein [Rubrobacter xylanophilus DSM 9941]|uniref:Alcohol dehydrogenase GroES-like protein n=1 Tax=Rubrobacter xylanophilus (strain DSM 9941 / JCM 11954 / NBRC 16129 / PRD-1) TaxID=266117 RepID=Q1AVM7_RUBXD|nr:zinc-binding dehydrogenase [Rubrobacter xylanophilus]ABG04551.1 Alcohol dehydrogenase GroES-like protein [Rubrobacter xylanophilus DSM 9941]
MKAFVKTGSRPGEAGVAELPAPRPGPGEVLLRVAACGVCGSDVHAFRSDPGFEWISTPVTLGHEFAGTVEALGPGVERVAPGDRVVAVAIQGCGRCELCLAGLTQLCPDRVAVGLSRDGGMAEYAVMPEGHLVSVPEGLDLTLAALCEPLSVAVRAVDARAGIAPEGKVVVSGPGPIGILCAMVARLRGADVLLTGIGQDAEVRLPAAERAGIRAANLSEASLEEHLRDAFGRPPDVWIESSGSVRALESALESVRAGGTVVVVGIYAERLNLFPTDAVRRELSLLFSYSCNLADYRTALELLASGDLDLGPLISTHRLEEAPDALEAVAAGRTVKAVLVP